MTLEYQAPGDEGAEELVAAIDEGDPWRLREAMVAAAYNVDDWEWLQSIFVRLLGHADPTVRAVAATCLGHVARIHRRLDTATVVPRIEALLSDPQTAGFAETALEDIDAAVR